MEKLLTPQRLRKRKALLRLPLLVVPFLTLAFWALGGGKNGAASSAEREGLNLELPVPQVKEEEHQNKLSFYEAARRDSARWRELIKADPFYPLPDTLPPPGVSRPGAFDPSPSGSSGFRDPAEEKVYQKLAELNRQLSPDPVASPLERAHGEAAPRGNRTILPSGEVDRLEEMMERMNQSSAPDGEMDRLSGMMDKILDIQHPERVRQRLQPATGKGKEGVFPVVRPPAAASVSLLESTGGVDKMANGEGFYSAADGGTPGEGNAVEAVVHQNQVMVNGAVMKLRLLSEIRIGDQLIPKDHFFFGVATLRGERLGIHVASIRYNQALFPVHLEVYDLDGLPGIFVPGALSREVARGAGSDAAQMLEITSLDPSLKAQAASVGMDAVKTLLSKKAKRVTVYVKGGYKVLLRDKSSRE